MTRTQTMKFYMLPGACSIVGTVALEWAGADYELVRMEHSGTKSPEFLAKNPQGSVVEKYFFHYTKF